MEEETDKKIKRSDWDIRPYLAIGALIFLVFCCCIAVFTVIFKYAAFKKACGVLMGVLQPILIGAVLGYMLNPILRRVDGGLCDLILPKVKNKDKAKGTIRTIASILTLLIFLAVIALIIYMMIPALVDSVTNFAGSMSANVNEFINWYENLEVLGKYGDRWEPYLMDVTGQVEEWLEGSLLPSMTDYLPGLTQSAINFVVVLKNVVIGLIVAVYVLIEKEHFEGQAKKIIYAVLPVKPANRLIAIVHKVDQIFGGFIIGKIIDSAIIGVICFIGCSILRMPYTLLVSVIVGVTNVIPFFGPFIGAIPCVIIVMITDPLHGLYLIIFIFLLQQVDGNIIGPKILGDSTGLSSFWVIFAIMVASGLFGFAGMLFGVPAFAVVYYLVQQLISFLLKRRGLPDSSQAYTEVTHINPDTNELCGGDWPRAEPFRFKTKKKITDQTAEPEEKGK